DLIDERTDSIVRRATRLGLRPVPTRVVAQSWIGEIPSHWDVASLRRVGSLTAGVAFPDEEQGRTDEAIPYFKVRDFETPGNGEFLRFPANTVSSDTARRLRSPIIEANSIVFPKIGAALLSNRRRILTSLCCLDQNVMALTVRHGVPKYFYYLLR